MLEYTPMQDVKKFHRTFSLNQSDEDISVKIERRKMLIMEESTEVLEALANFEHSQFSSIPFVHKHAKEELAKELADLLYVVYGTAEELSIPLEEVFQIVHNSNMSKVWDDGEVHYNEYGKVLKPPEYTKPDLSFIHDN